MTLTRGRSGLFHAGVKLPAIPGTNMPESPVEAWGQEPGGTEAVNWAREGGLDFLRVRRGEARCPATWKGESSSWAVAREAGQLLIGGHRCGLVRAGHWKGQEVQPVPGAQNIITKPTKTRSHLPADHWST